MARFPLVDNSLVYPHTITNVVCTEGINSKSRFSELLPVWTIYRNWADFCKKTHLSVTGSNWVGSAKRCRFPNCLIHLHARSGNESWNSDLLYHRSFDLKPKCLQYTAETTELSLLFKHSGMGLYNHSLRSCIERSKQSIQAIWQVYRYRNNQMLAVDHPVINRIILEIDCLPFTDP